MTEEDLSAILDAVDAFVERAVAPLSARPERPALPKDVEGVVAAAAAVGLIEANGGDEGGAALWQDPGASPSLRVSTETLVSVARASAAVAHQLHALALGARLLRRLGAPAVGWTLPLLDRAGGLARGALAPWLAGAAPDPLDRDLLADHFPHPEAAGGPVLLQAAEPWDALVAPVWDPERASIRWMRFARADLVAEAVEAAHGLDESRVWRLGRLGCGGPIEASDGEARAALVEAMGLNALGLMAIGAGCAEGAVARAERYARERIQGGGPIAEHEAVRSLLGGARSNVVAVRALCESVSRAPRDLAGLRKILALRAVAHSLLCRAATDALQVFGGYGYMRDYGMEKALRDSRHLRLLAGTPADVALFVARGESS